MFGQRQKFDMSVAHVHHIGHQRVGQFAIGQIFIAVFAFAPPRTGMHFINGHRTIEAVMAFGAAHPFAVVPVIVVQVINDGGRVRAFFGIKTDWIGF